MTDSELIEGLSQRSQAAVDFLYREYKPPLMQMLRAKKLSQQAAEDIFQDAVIAELQHRPLRPLTLISATYKTYFRTICLNLFRNYCRKNNRLANVTPEELSLPGSDPVIEEQLNRTAFRRIIERGLRALGEDCRKLIRDQLIAQKTLNELAEKMGISHANARQRASRCRKKLRLIIAADPVYHEMIAK